MRMHILHRKLTSPAAANVRAEQTDAGFQVDNFA